MKQFIIYTLIFFTLSYLVVGFITGLFNPFTWTVEGRFLFIFFTTIANGFIYIALKSYEGL